MKTFLFEVVQTVQVTVDETRLDAAFMAEFEKHFFPIDTIEGHAKHIAQLVGRGVVDGDPDEFVEGYGPLGEMGIKARRGSSYTETLVGDV